MPGVLALAADIMTVVVGNPPLYTRLTQIRGAGRDAQSCRTAYEWCSPPRSVFSRGGSTSSTSRRARVLRHTTFVRRYQR